MLVLRTYSKKDKEKLYDYKTSMGDLGIIGAGVLSSAAVENRLLNKAYDKYSPELGKINKKINAIDAYRDKYSGNIFKRKTLKRLSSDRRKLIDQLRDTNVQFNGALHRKSKIGNYIMLGGIGAAAGYDYYRQLKKKDKLK